jgi:hypothetical protein
MADSYKNDGWRLNSPKGRSAADVFLQSYWFSLNCELRDQKC